MALGPLIGTTPIWWEIQNIPDQMIEELRRRSNSNNIGQSYPKLVNFNYEAKFREYKGPLTPWVRVFSNSTGKPLNILTPPSGYLLKNNQEYDYNGFILKGGDGFFDAFGYSVESGLRDRNAIIGYEADGKPHYLNGSKNQLKYSAGINKQFPQKNEVPRILPPPGIVSVNVKQTKEFLTFGSFKFKCYSLAQLEYLTPFFLNPGINVFIEFGWNLFNQKSLLDLTNLSQCWQIVSIPQTALDRAMDSYGNYGCISGIITKYNFNTVDGFVYDCNVEIISRQGLYAGMRTDNVVTINTQVNNTSTTQNSVPDNNKMFLNLKNFIKIYLPAINDVIRQPKGENTDLNFGNLNPNENFYTYVKNNFKQIAQKYATSLKQDLDAAAQKEQLNTVAVQSLPQEQPSTGGGVNQLVFYDGKPEDRVFTGRRYDVYKKSKSPEQEVSISIPSTQTTQDNRFDPEGYGSAYQSEIQTVKVKTEPIEYANVVKNVGQSQITFKQLSFFDNNDFDAKDNNDEVWLQLDFIIEVFNLFMSNNVTNRFKLDIQDIIVNAHPNLMSLNKDLLIPNPVSPKINKGRFNNENNKRSTGYLKNDAAILGKNKYLDLFPDIQMSPKSVKLAQSKLNEKQNLNYQEGLKISSLTLRNRFKTAFYERDNIDTIINYLYYHSPNNNPEGSAAFPFSSETNIFKNVGTEEAEIINNKPYKPYYYGYLKHLYISKTKVIDIVNNTDIKNYKELLKSLFDFINTSVDNFWKFDVVDRTDGKGLAIVDKNGVGDLDKIYTFDIGSTTNVIKSINFDVSLSAEQAVNVYFGGSVDQNLTKKYKEKISNIQTNKENQAIYSRLTNEPQLKFADRMDSYELAQFLINQSGSLNETVQPGTPEGFVDENNDIAYLQTYGKKEDVLTVQVKYFLPDEDVKLIDKLTFAQRLALFERRYRPQVPSQGPLQQGMTIPPSVLQSVLQRGALLDRVEEQLDKTNELLNIKFLNWPESMRGMLRSILTDGDYYNNPKYSGVADNFTATIVFDGIFGFRNLQCFAIDNLPKPYVPGNVIFQILEAEHQIDSGKWTTTVTALVRSVGGSNYEYIPV